jgi:hypothetical protein
MAADKSRKQLPGFPTAQEVYAPGEEARRATDRQPGPRTGIADVAMFNDQTISETESRIDDIAHPGLSRVAPNV